MADTGLPWELPYPLPTDLVRDGADAIKDLAEATATGLDEAGNAGIGSNVVQAVVTASVSTTSATFVDVTGMTVTITPSSATAKVLIIADYRLSNTSATFGALTQLVRDATPIYLGDSGHGVQVSGGSIVANAREQYQTTNVFIDSPETTSAVTYKLQFRRGFGGTAFFNRNGSGDADFRGACSITAIEVAE